MRKVFSLEKWKQDMLAIGASEELLSLFTWPIKCDGLTREEMKEEYCATLPGWMVEVEDEILRM